MAEFNFEINDGINQPINQKQS